MGVPAVIIHFLLGLSMKQIIQLLGYFHFRKPQDIGHGRVNDDCSTKTMENMWFQILTRDLIPLLKPIRKLQVDDRIHKVAKRHIA
jgi:hypothetical protein